VNEDTAFQQFPTYIISQVRIAPLSARQRSWRASVCVCPMISWRFRN